MYVQFRDSFPLMAVPFFILAVASWRRRPFSTADPPCNGIVGSTRGGLATVTILACAFFGAISGSVQLPWPQLAQS